MVSINVLVLKLGGTWFTFYSALLYNYCTSEIIPIQNLEKFGHKMEFVNNVFFPPKYSQYNIKE